MKPSLQLQNVTKIYLAPRNNKTGVRDVVIALHRINLTVMPGERVGIIGRNGAGKSTLLRAIGGTLNLTGGRIIRQHTPRMVMTLGGSFLNEFTGRENLYMYASFLGMLKKEVDALFTSMVDFSGLYDVIDEPLRNYSNGMRTRLAFAVATAGNPTLICMDELLAAGDQAFQELSTQHLINLSQKGATAIITHHNLAAITQYATRVIWLEDGRIVADGDPTLVCKQYEDAA